ncbi:hypothetical protein AB0H36_47500 [Kribbella sp. NPDC050820]|uniref:hypothetical protein n=1 Tax=Kribbella sp. NPDC050820 TaxID=3155408 RepID=UPI0033FA14AB
MTAPVRGRRRTARAAAHRRARPCPTCGHTPIAAAEAIEQRHDLQVVWLTETPTAPGHLTTRRFCAECQPRGAVYPIVCRICADGPIVTGPLAEQAAAGELPPVVADALTADGWRQARDGDGWVCPRCARPAG